MKKLTAIMLFIFSASLIYSQTPNNQPAGNKGSFKGGIMINPFVAWPMGIVDDPNKNKVENGTTQFGFAYGLIGDFFFNNNYGIELNPRVSSFTTEFKYYRDANSGFFIDRTLHLQYVEVPITLKMRTNEIGYMKYFAQFGLMPAVKIGARGDIFTNDTTSHITEVKNLNVTNDVNIFMLYSVIGLGIEYNLGGTTNIVASVTWSNGFTNVWNKQNDVITPPTNPKNNPPSTPYTLSNFNSPVGNISLNIGVLF